LAWSAGEPGRYPIEVSRSIHDESADNNIVFRSHRDVEAIGLARLMGPNLSPPELVSVHGREADDNDLLDW